MAQADAQTSSRAVGEAEGPIAKRYHALEGQRNVYLMRARDAARLTIPYLFPPFDYANAATMYPTPWQSVGARGTNNLASKLLLALFPPNECFLRMMVLDNPVILKQVAEDPQFKSELDAALSKYEDEIQKFLETSNARPSFFEVFKQMICAGNALIYAHQDKHEDKFKVRVFRLDHYVVKRAPNGRVLEIIAKEVTDPRALSLDVQEACGLRGKSGITADGEGSNNYSGDTITIWTHVKRVDGAKKFTVCQEINGVEVPGSDGEYTHDECPWIALRWSKMDNEDYGRGFVEEYIGDLRSLDGLSQALIEGAAIMSKMVPMVNPNGITRAKDLTSKANGEPIVGMPTDVHFLQVEKFPDLKFAVEVAQTITGRLEQAFLLANAIQRQAERVTAEEIQIMARDLEDGLGGLYSLLSQELQMPFAKIIISVMEKQKLLPRLPKGVSQPAIITGMEALGRGQDSQKLSQLIQGAGQDLGPGVVQQYVNLGEYFRRKSTALTIDPNGLIKSDDEVQQAQQAAQQSQMQSAIAPHVVDAVGKHQTATTVQAMKQGHEQQMAQQPQK